MAWYNWSQTAASNATADTSINWAEGQAPSSVNDSARAMMAATAKYRDDIAGAIVTGGISTAYTVASYSVFDTLAHLGGQMIAFTPHVTNGATVTLNVDALGAKPLRTSPGVELSAGTIIQGTPYVATYNNSDGAFYLQGFFGNPYNIPLASGLDYWGPSAPSSSFAFPSGQAISRTTYASLFSLLGTTWGAGDGSTTFNLPDKRGRFSAGKDDMGGNHAFRIQAANSGFAGDTLGAAGGSEIQTLTLAQLPTGIASSNAAGFNVTVTSTDANLIKGGLAAGNSGGGAGLTTLSGASSIQETSTGTVPAGTVISQSTNTSGAAHTIINPTIICNYIMRII